MRRPKVYKKFQHFFLWKKSDNLSTISLTPSTDCLGTSQRYPRVLIRTLPLKLQKIQYWICVTSWNHFEVRGVLNGHICFFLEQCRCRERSCHMQKMRCAARLHLMNASPNVDLVRGIWSKNNTLAVWIGHSPKQGWETNIIFVQSSWSQTKREDVLFALNRRKLIPGKSMKELEVWKAQRHIAFLTIRQHTAAIWMKHAVTPEIDFFLSLRILREICIPSMLRPMITTFETSLSTWTSDPPISPMLCCWFSKIFFRIITFEVWTTQWNYISVPEVWGCLFL